MANAFEGEFTRKSIVGGIIRVALIFLSLFFVVAGAVTFSLWSELIGNLLVAAAILIIAYSTYLSFSDKSAIKCLISQQRYL